MKDGNNKLNRLPITNRELWRAKPLSCKFKKNESFKCWYIISKGQTFFYYEHFHMNNFIIEGIQLRWSNEDTDYFKLRDDTDEHGKYIGDLFA
jgi:hypothetical protein